MGLMCSWIAVKGVTKDALLADLGFEETGEPDEPGTRYSGMSVGEVPGGWVILFNCNFEWASEDRVRDLSRFGEAVGLQFEDKVEMASIACAAMGGTLLWRVSHVNDGEYNLEVSGQPPAELDAIRDQYFHQQDEDGGVSSSVDFIHEIPIALAKSVCGYRLDEDEQTFIVLKGPGIVSEDYPKRTVLDFFKSVLLPPRRPR